MAIELIEIDAGPTAEQAKVLATETLANLPKVKWTASDDKYGVLSDGWEWVEFRDKFCPNNVDCVSPDTTCAIARQYPGAGKARPCVELIRAVKLDSAQAGKAKMDKVAVVIEKIKNA